MIFILILSLSFANYVQLLLLLSFQLLVFLVLLFLQLYLIIFLCFLHLFEFFTQYCCIKYSLFILILFVVFCYQFNNTHILKRIKDFLKFQKLIFATPRPLFCNLFSYKANVKGLARGYLFRRFSSIQQVFLIQIPIKTILARSCFGTCNSLHSFVFILTPYFFRKYIVIYTIQQTISYVLEMSLRRISYNDLQEKDAVKTVFYGINLYSFKLKIMYLYLNYFKQIRGLIFII